MTLVCLKKMGLEKPRAKKANLITAEILELQK